MNTAARRLATMTLAPTFINKVDKSVPQCRPIGISSTSVPIVLLHSVNPFCFWFCELQEYRELKELMSRMKTFYDNQGQKLVVSKHHLQPGLNVAVNWGSEWFRCKVITLVDSKRARVFCFDSGAAEDVSIDKAYYLRTDFALMPATALRGILSYVKPKDGTWNKSSIKFMQNRCGQEFEAKIHSTDPTEQAYYLSIKKADEQHQFSDSLIQSGACFMDAGLQQRTECPNLEDFIYYEDGRHLDLVDDWLPKTPKQDDSRAQAQVLAKVEKCAPKPDRTPVTEPTPAKALPLRKFVIPDKRKRLEMPPRASILDRISPLKLPYEVTPTASKSTSPSESKQCTKSIQQPKAPTSSHILPLKIAQAERSCSKSKQCINAAQRSTSAPKNRKSAKSIQNRLQQTPVPQQIPTASKSATPIQSYPVVVQPSPPVPPRKEKPISQMRAPPNIRSPGVQDLSKLEIRSKIEIIVHVINDRDDFYFFLKNELQCFLQEFQERFE